jgi:ribosomal protein S14
MENVTKCIGCGDHQGHLAKAVEMYQRSLAIRKQVLGVSEYSR